MQASQSTQDLEQAINELDGIFLELADSAKAHSPQKAAQRPAFNKNLDYDVPRPAEGVFNASRRNTANFSAKMNEEDSKIMSPDHYQTVSPRFPKSPSTASHGSEQSSGLGTLPKYSSIKIPAHMEFPGPPKSTPPSRALQSDSDYDEVASISEESEKGTQGNGRLVESVSPDGPVYSVVRKHQKSSRDVNRRDNAQRGDNANSDYDDPWSEPNSQRTSMVGQEKPDSAIEKIPMVVRATRISHSPPTTTIETSRAQLETSASTRKKEVRLRSPTYEEVRNFECPAFPVREAAEEKDPKSSPLDQSNSTEKNRDRRSASDHQVMDPESQKGENLKKERGPTCPCECRAAVPLMSVAVIFTIALLFGLIITFVYYGLQVNEYLANPKDNTTQSVDTTTTSGMETTGSGAGTSALP